MSDLSSNGHFPPDGEAPQREAPLLPRIAPPDGVRAARGQLPDSSSDQSADSTPQSEPISVAAASAIEDSYEPPFDADLESSPHEAPLVAPFNGAPPFASRPDTPKDVELGLMEHLNELRVRLLWCAVILVLGMMVTWNFGKPLQEWFAKPILKVLVAKETPGVTGGNELISTDPTGFFSIYFQFSLVSALILTAPLLFWQVWRFVEPALTQSERRYSLVLVPFSSALFFLGAGLGYVVSPLFYQFFIAFQPAGIAAKWDYYQSIVLMAKMLLVFGIMFEVPVVIIFLNKVGIVSRNLLIEYWRHAVVAIFTIVAILTPTWDPVTLTVCAVPPCLLYVLSIWLVKWL